MFFRFKLNLFPFSKVSIFIAILFLSQNSFTMAKPNPKPSFEESS